MCTNSTGNRCQYPTLCSEPDKCADEELCLETLLAPSGFVCVEPSEGGTLTVEGVEINIRFLDDLLVNFREALLQQVVLHLLLFAHFIVCILLSYTISIWYLF